MATSSFDRKIIVTGKEATDMIIDAITSDTKIEKDEKDEKDDLKIEKSIVSNHKRRRALLKKLVSHYKK